MSAILNFITFSLSSCESKDVLLLFWRKSEILPKFILRAITVSSPRQKIVITVINRVSNVVVTGTNLFRKHQVKNICFSLFTFNQSKIQFETREH